MTGSRLRYLKQLLTRFGAQLSEGALYNNQLAVNYMELGDSMKRSGYDSGTRVDHRMQVFEEVASSTRSEQVLYLRSLRI